MQRYQTFNIGDLVKTRLSYKLASFQPGMLGVASKLVIHPGELYVVLGQSNPDENPEMITLSNGSGVIGDVNGVNLELVWPTTSNQGT